MESIIRRMPEQSCARLKRLARPELSPRPARPILFHLNRYAAPWAQLFGCRFGPAWILAKHWRGATVAISKQFAPPQMAASLTLRLIGSSQALSSWERN